MFRTDGGGLALRIDDAKLSTTHSASTWSSRLSQIGKSNGKVIICTYSLPNMDYLRKIFDKRTSKITLIAHEKFSERAGQLKKLYPDLQVVLKQDVHAKFVLIEPDIVWLSSANFGSSGWFEQTIGLHSKEAYDYMLKQVNEYMGVIS
jgi:hypothetical protein